MKRRSSILAAVLILGAAAILVVIAGNRWVEPPRPSSQARPWSVQRPITPPEAQPSPASPSSATPAPATAGPRLVWSANTGDAARWPHYDAPLVIHVEAPAVPPEIAKVAPPLDRP